MPNSPISLNSDAELDAVITACQPLESGRRDAFLRELAAELGRYRGGLGPGAVYRVIRDVQRHHFDPPDLGGLCHAPKHARGR
jgi:hypothetical protein